jgi:hypothetical protein
MCYSLKYTDAKKKKRNNLTTTSSRPGIEPTTCIQIATSLVPTTLVTEYTHYLKELGICTSILWPEIYVRVQKKGSDDSADSSSQNRTGSLHPSLGSF